MYSIKDSVFLNLFVLFICFIFYCLVILLLERLPEAYYFKHKVALIMASISGFLWNAHGRGELSLSG